MTRRLCHTMRSRGWARTAGAPGRGKPATPARARRGSARAGPRRLLSFFQAGLALLLWVALPSLARAEVQRIASLGARIDWDTGEVMVAAKVPASRGKSEAALKAAALNVARENLKSVLDRVSQGGSGAYDIPGKADKARLAALVGTAQVTSARRVAAGYEVTLSLTLTRNAVGGDDEPLPEARVPVFAEPGAAAVRSFPAPPATGEEALLTPKDAKGPFSGVIVDARGLGVRSGMSPQIVDAAMREVYGGEHIPIGVVEDIGVASFSATIATALRLPRVGKRPLVLRAVGSAEPNGVRPVISIEDARRLLGDLGVPEIIKKGAVCIVVGECAPASSAAPASTDPAK